jgi:hypothetical protein
MVRIPGVLRGLGCVTAGSVTGGDVVEEDVFMFILVEEVLRFVSSETRGG